MVLVKWDIITGGTGIGGFRGAPTSEQGYEPLATSMRSAAIKAMQEAIGAPRLEALGSDFGSKHFEALMEQLSHNINSCCA